MQSLFRNRHVWLFVGVYGMSLGVLLPLVALAACRGMPTPAPSTQWRNREALTMFGLLGWIALFLSVKGPLLAALLPADPDPRLQEAINTLLKLGAFVAVPAAVLWSRGLRRDLAGRPAASKRRLWICFIVVAFAGFAVQYLLGSQFRKLLGGDYADRHLALGAALCFLWMSIEAGVVEEFFFRWYLQSRLAAWTKSQVSAVILGALLFGLAHAPGIVLRGAGGVEGLGDSPSIGTTLAYVVATQGVAGLTFGVLWSRTRSFVLVVALHGFIDALSNTASFMDTWGF